MSVNSAGKLGATIAATWSRGFEQGEGALGVVAHLLRVLAADAQAVAAADAAGLDDARLPVDHPDGLGRALPHAGVAHAALVGRRW